MSTEKSVLVDGPSSMHILTMASIPAEDREVAWAAARDKMDIRPDMGWVMGRFVKADSANLNGHIFGLEDLQNNHSNIVNTPLNMLHKERYIVGHFVATELLYPTDTASDPDGIGTPFVEALANVYRFVFASEWDDIKRAHADGRLAFSMEALADSLTCGVCQANPAYAGVKSDTYCDHLNTVGSPKWLNNPHFVGGAIVLPPAKPGWDRADIKEIATYVENHSDESDQVYRAFRELMPHLDDADWEALMVDAMVDRAKRQVGSDKHSLVEARATLPDGSWRVVNKAELKNMLALYRRSMSSDASRHQLINADAVREHLISRARSLGAESMVEDLLAPQTAAVSGGAIFAIVPPPEIATEIAKMGDQTSDQIHITSLYLGKPDDLALTLDDAKLVLGAIAAVTEPFDVTIAGAGRFVNNNEVATWLLPEGAELGEINEKLTDVFVSAGIIPEPTRSYVPHITFTYELKEDDPIPAAPQLGWHVDSIELWWSGERFVGSLTDDGDDSEPDGDPDDADPSVATAKVDTLAVGTKVTWHYRSAIGHGTIAGVHKLGTTSANTEYSIHEADHHPGEPATVYHYGRALTVV